MSKTKTRVRRVFGRTGLRPVAEPPTYRCIAPGLIVTDESVWAWFTVAHTNSDLLGEEGRGREEDAAVAATRVLTGRTCQLKILWGTQSGDRYLHGLGLPDDDPEKGPKVREWAELRADSIDDLALPERHLLLGVELARREVRGGSLGLIPPKLGTRQLRSWEAAARQLGTKLAATLWRVRLASPELLAWMIVRETHREAEISAERTIQGAELARLAGGRIVPMSDHLRAHDSEGRVSAYIAVLALSDFPETLTTPGQEWLAVINHLVTEPLMRADDESAEPMPVLAEVSMRFKVPKSGEAREIVDDVRRVAKDQRRAASRTSAEEPPEHVLEAETEASALSRRLTRRHTQLIEAHPRIIVTGATRAEMDEKIVAVQAAYDDIGITASVCVDEQRDVWIESLPCDRVRVPDLGHWQDAEAFVQSWWWGGSSVGTADPRVPVVGYATGSTTGSVRFLVTDGVSKGDAPIVVFLGRTRRGKTTAMVLAILDALLAAETQDGDPVAILVDTKGDAAGIIRVCELMGIPVQIVHADTAPASACDPWLTSLPIHAVDTCVSQLVMLLPARYARDHQHVLSRWVSDVAQTEKQPRAWKVIEAIARAGESDPAAAELAATLKAATYAGWGRLVAGRPDPAQSGEGDALPSAAQEGLTLVSLAGLDLPEADDRADDWTPVQRASIAALRGVLGWCTAVTANIEDRSRPKIVAYPEVHLLTATNDGRSWLVKQARMGAAFGITVLLDTQDVTGITKMPGLIEGISAVFGFQQRSREQQDALAELVGLSASAETRAVIDDLATTSSARQIEGDTTIRRGHCLYQDRAGRVATMQWVIPSQEVARMLDTSPEATAARHAGVDPHSRSEWVDEWIPDLESGAEEETLAVSQGAGSE